MSRRYGDIKRGGELKTALDSKTAWELNTNGARKTRRLTGGTGTKRDQKLVTIMPFSLKAATTNPVRYVIKMHGKSFTTTAGSAFAKTKADNYYDATPENAAKAEKPPSGFRPARLSTFQSTATGTTIDYTQAKATKLWYPKRVGDSYYYPIGRANTDPNAADEKETKQAIKTDLIALLNAAAGRTATFSDEKAGGLA